MRLSQYLKQKHPGLSSRQVKRMLEQGACLVNGKIESFGSRMIDPKKDKVKFTPIKQEAVKKLSIKKSDVIYEDDYILVYNKQAGWASLPTESKDVNHLEQIKKVLELKFLEPVHRLDKNTSGLLLFSKKKEVTKLLSELFAKKQIKKTYLAVVDGVWKHAVSGKIENYLTLDYKKGPLQKWKVAKKITAEQKRNTQKFKLAITKFKLVKNCKSFAQLELEPETGRTHQLRVQFSDLGYPILGDTIYAYKFKTTKPAKRHLLHAQRLEFSHPITKKGLRLEAPMPPDIKDFLKD